MSYLSYLCFFAHSGVFVLFLCLRLVSSVPIVANSLDCPYFYCPFGVF